MKMLFRLIETENNHTITKSSDCDFMFLMQRAALLGLKDAGFLSVMQYRQAEAALLQQYREDLRMLHVEAQK